MSFTNQLGFLLSFSVMNEKRKSQKKMSTPNFFMVQKELFLKLCLDIIDARSVGNVIRLEGKSLDWHSTILIQC